MISVFCARCGTELDCNVKNDKIVVDFCTECGKDEWNDGNADGYNEGLEAGNGSSIN